VRFLRDERAQGLLEYGLILGLVAMVAIGALLAFGNGSERTLERAGKAFASAAPGSGTLH